MLETCNLSKLRSYSYGICNQPILAFTFCYLDDVLSRSNSRFGDFIGQICPIELQIKDTTDTDRSASYLDLHFAIDSEGWLTSN